MLDLKFLLELNRTELLARVKESDYSPTTDHNKELLTKELGLKQIANTSLFWDDGLLVFSPAIAKNTQDYYWFDIREVNIERMHQLAPDKSLLLVRLVSNMFLLHPFEDIEAIFEAPRNLCSGKKNGIS